MDTDIKMQRKMMIEVGSESVVEMRMRNKDVDARWPRLRLAMAEPRCCELAHEPLPIRSSRATTDPRYFFRFDEHLSLCSRLGTKREANRQATYIHSRKDAR